METFTDMKNWNLAQLTEKRDQLRNELSAEIQKRDALRAEIVYLQKQIAIYRSEHER